MFKVLNVFQVSHSLSGHANCLYKIEECQMRGVLCAWLGWVGSQGGGMPNCIKVCMSFAIYASEVHGNVFNIQCISLMVYARCCKMTSGIL